MARKPKPEPKTRIADTARSRGYPDLHEHLEALERAGLLITVDREINKDTEMHPLVRWQFRGGIAEKDRKAFLFTNVIDSKNRKYDIPVVVGALAAWGSRHLHRGTALVHDACGHAVKLGYFCPDCGTRIRGATVKLAHGVRL